MQGDPKNRNISEPLLAALREATGEREITYAEPPVQIEGGFDTRIFGFRLANAAGPLAAPLILRLFAQDDDPSRARWEATVQDAVSGLGYPAPRVVAAQGPDNALRAAFVVMERIPGAPMLKAATFGEMLPEAARLVRRYPAVLADYLARLHALDTEPLAQALLSAGLLGEGPSAGISQRTTSLDRQLDQLAGRIDRLSLDGLRPGLRWLRERRPKAPARASICHGDFHPINVLMEDGRVTGVIDWANGAIGDSASDVGNTRLLLAIAPLDQPAAVDAVVGILRRFVVRRFTRAYQTRVQLDMAVVHYFEALRCLVELAWVAERRAAGAGMERNPWGAPRSVGKLAAHFGRVSAIKVGL
jgi:aminoglycoside phosphotransferase (APT) family kinase protein